MKNYVTRERAAVAALLCLILLAPGAAHAQAFGGSFLSGLLNWVQSNVITTLGTLAIIVAGLVLMAMRVSLVAILAICAGIWIVFNADTLIGMLRQ